MIETTRFMQLPLVGGGIVLIHASKICSAVQTVDGKTEITLDNGRVTVDVTYEQFIGRLVSGNGSVDAVSQVQS